MKKNNNHVLCHKIGKNRTSQNNFAFNIFQFISLVILLLKTNYCFGQPSSDSWKEVISKMYTRAIESSHHKNCVFPFKLEINIIVIVIGMKIFLTMFVVVLMKTVI